MKILQPRVITPCLHIFLLGIGAYLLPDLRILALVSMILFFTASFSEPGFILLNLSEKSKAKEHHHKQSSSVTSHLTAISAVKPMNPSTNTSALPQIHIESFDGSHSDRVQISENSENSFGEQFYQLSEGDVPNLQQLEGSNKIALSKPIQFKPEPASPPIYSQEDSSEAKHENENITREMEIGPSYCTICHYDQPLRAKHCNQCKHCVAMFDHHCPFLGICIGEKNRLAFFWFVFFQGAECWVGFFIAVFTIDDEHDWDLWTRNNFQVVVIATVALLLGLFIFVLWTFHFTLAIKNLTTWETMRWEKITYLADKKKSPFDRGIWKNLGFYCKKHVKITEWQNQL